MDPLTALSVATGVLSIVDFAQKLLQRTYKIYTSTSGRLEKHVSLQEISTNLKALSDSLQLHRNVKSEAERQVQRLQNETEEISQKLLAALADLEIKSGRKVWDCFRQALASAWSESKIQELEDRLEAIPGRMNTALIVCLREKVDSIDVLIKDTRKLQDYMQDDRKWKADILHELRNNNWQEESLSRHLDRKVRDQRKARFTRIISRRLNFDRRTERERQIQPAYHKTFDWLYTESRAECNKLSFDSFSAWLESKTDTNVYWVTGKPGSGKSTLMSFLWKDPRTAQYLNTWCSGRPILTAAFFFWISGAADLQKSREGLVQSILLQILSKHADLTTRVFYERWELYDAGCGGLQPLTWSELSHVFSTLLSVEHYNFFLVIDGLDEFKGDSDVVAESELEELVETITKTGEHKNVKICVSSRPWPVFEAAFNSRPNLYIEKLTRNDIYNYVSEKFNENHLFKSLQKRNSGFANGLIEKISDKSSGVFLWVYLVVASLLTRLQKGDRLIDLEDRLAKLPHKLEELFNRLLESVEPQSYPHACQLIVLVEAMLEAKGSCWLYELGLADENNVRAVIEAPIKASNIDEETGVKDDMRRRLADRCKCLFDIGRGGEVTYLHRTAREYVRMEKSWQKIVKAAGESFDPRLSMSCTYLYRLKTNKDVGLGPDTQTFWAWLWNSSLRSIQHLSFIRGENKGVLLQFLDSLDLTARTLAERNWRKRDQASLDTKLMIGSAETPYWISICSNGHAELTKIQSFLEFAVWSCPLRDTRQVLKEYDLTSLETYAWLKLKEMDSLDKATARRLLGWKPSTPVMTAIKAATRRIPAARCGDLPSLPIIPPKANDDAGSADVEKLNGASNSEIRELSPMELNKGHHKRLLLLPWRFWDKLTARSSRRVNN